MSTEGHGTLFSLLLSFTNTDGHGGYTDFFCTNLTNYTNVLLHCFSYTDVFLTNTDGHGGYTDFFCTNFTNYTNLFFYTASLFYTDVLFNEHG